MEKHIDEKDMITAFLTLGNPTEGGKTRYYSGSKVSSTNRILHSVKFAHGQLQIGQLNEIIHDVEPWLGTRLTLNFNVKSDIISHFREYGYKFYETYEKSDYKSKLIFLEDYKDV